MSETQVQEVNQNLTEFKFRFKEDKLGNKRAAVQIVVPTIGLAEIARIAMTTQVVKDEKTGVESEVPSKEAELLKEAIDAIYQSQIRDIVNEKEDVSQANFPMDQATWKFIAEMDRTSRRGAGIAKEVWDSWAENFCAVMPAVTGKSAEATAQAAQIYVRKFRDVMGNMPVVEKLVTYLSMYMEAPGNKAEEFSDVLEFLAKKGKDILSLKDKAAALANI